MAGKKQQQQNNNNAGSFSQDDYTSSCLWVCITRGSNSHTHPAYSPLVTPHAMLTLLMWQFTLVSSNWWSIWNKEYVSTGSSTRNMSCFIGPQQVAINRRTLGCLSTDRLSISCTINSGAVHLAVMLCSLMVTSKHSHWACLHLLPSAAIQKSPLPWMNE